MGMNDDSKQALRAQCWQRIERCGAARWPGTRGRIPNFIGAEQAAATLSATPEFLAANVIKCNPDTPQRALRYAALRAGKTLYVAVPKLAAERPFVVIDPGHLPRHFLWDASSKTGFIRWGRPVSAAELTPIELIVTGSVGVSRSGARLGKGGGYADLEFSLLRANGKISDGVLVATTAHASQVCPDGAITMDANDVSVDIIATPEELIRCRRIFSRPSTIDPALLHASRRGLMPPIDAALKSAADED